VTNLIFDKNQQKYYAKGFMTNRQIYTKINENICLWNPL